MDTPTSTIGTQSPEPVRRRGGAFKKGFFVFLAVLVILAGLTVGFLMTASYSEGYRVGTIQKISKKGMIFKSFEGDLAQGFLDSSDASAENAGVATRTFSFTVPVASKDVQEQIDRAIAANKRVKLHYEERYRILPWVGDTPYIVTKVEEIQ